ncbi:hypothetical protein Sango_1874100 [Sesamum angolense]|uniref:Reverse transcriptase zinc-binding domain-containing protein n=1 Tax=Sesamum angolense TaxID=2727404 RepID=A0AAE1WIZ0_9LAMI|nr:hypothetical protein Sango_1874100 [Sesamum angolense]
MVNRLVCGIYDRWLSREPDFKPTRTMFGPLDDLHVSDLIDHSNSSWRTALIVENFHPFDAQHILAIQLGRNNSQDHGSKSRNVSVKTVHHLALKPAENSSPSDIVEVVITTNWNFIWQQLVSNKIKVFGWKKCNNALPSVNNLMKRKVEIVDFCPVCEAVGENIPHALFGRSVMAGNTMERNVTAEGDCMDIIKRVVSKDEDYSPIGTIVDDIDRVPDAEYSLLQDEVRSKRVELPCS